MIFKKEQEQLKEIIRQIEKVKKEEQEELENMPIDVLDLLVKNGRALHDEFMLWCKKVLGVEFKKYLFLKK